MESLVSIRTTASLADILSMSCLAYSSPAIRSLLDIKHESPLASIKLHNSIAFACCFDENDMNMLKRPEGWIKVSCHMPLVGAKIFARQYADICTVIWPENLVKELNDDFSDVKQRYSKVVKQFSDDR